MGFNIFLALSSPCPVLVDTMAGSSIMVISTTLYMLFTTLLKEIISIDIICTRRHSGEILDGPSHGKIFFEFDGNAGTGRLPDKLLGTRSIPVFHQREGSQERPWVLGSNSISRLKIIKKVSFASVLRNKVNSMRLLLWFGAVTQIGSFCGAITSYPLVNCIEGIFVPRYDCQSCLWLDN